MGCRPGYWARSATQYCPAPRFHPGLGLNTPPLVNLGVANDAALPPLTASGLELRLNQRDQPRSWLSKLQRLQKHLGNADETCIANDDVDQLRDDIGIERASVRLLVDDDTRILPELPGKLDRADIHRIDFCRPAREQYVGQPASRTSYVKRHGARYLQ